MSETKNKFEVIDIAPLIHQTALDPFIEEETFNEMCDVARHFHFAGFCTNAIQTSTARKRLGSQNGPKLITVIAFPFGAIPTSIKKAEIEWAAEQGADGVDVVPNFFALKQGNIDFFAEELAELCEIGLPTRVVLNFSQLSVEKLKIAIEACLDAGASGIQTGNGFGPSITPEQIGQAKKFTRKQCSIKAFGGLKEINQILSIIEAGADLIGTSRGAQLMKVFRQNQS